MRPSQFANIYKTNAPPIKETPLKIHMYEFRSDKKKLKCSCGWERTLKSSDSKVVQKTFADHCPDAAKQS